MAQLRQESGCVDGRVSRTGAVSLAQFMPSTAKHVEVLDPSLAALARYSPTWAFRAQAVYMKWIVEQIEARPGCETWAFGLSAYNGGLGWVYKRQSKSRWPNYCLGLTCYINPGILASNQIENERYVSRILLDLEPAYLAYGPGACN